MVYNKALDDIDRDSCIRWLVVADMLAEMQKSLDVPVWVMGISELGPRGIFAPWSTALKLAYAGALASDRNRLYALKHFSMGAFATDMKKYLLPGESQGQAALRIGADLASRLWPWHQEQ